MKYFIDANIFLRVAIREDEEAFGQCTRLLQLIKTNKIKAVTSSTILAEMVWVLGRTYSQPKGVVIKLLRNTLNTNNLRVVDDYDMRRAIDLYERHNVKFIDAIIASVNMVASKRWTIVSYDEDFKKLPVKWKLPKDII